MKKIHGTLFARYNKNTCQSFIYFPAFIKDIQSKHFFKYVRIVRLLFATRCLEMFGNQNEQPLLNVTHRLPCC